MSQVRSTCGLILLGNTGVGKSFLANVLLDKEAFVHECSLSSVTHKTEFEEIKAGKTTYAIFNIPGLLEANQERIDLNKTEIYKAFELRPNSVVAFVFNGGAGGRLRDEDLIAFRAIHEAYRFQSESLVFIINDLPTNRSEKYQGAAVVKLEEYTAMKPAAVCFLDRLLDPSDKKQQESIRIKLLDAITQCTPREHTKKADIQLKVEQIQQQLEESRRIQKKIEEEMAGMQERINQKQKEIDEAKNRPPVEIHHYHERIVERDNGGCIVC